MFRLLHVGLNDARGVSKGRSKCQGSLNSPQEQAIPEAGGRDQGPNGRQAEPMSRAENAFGYGSDFLRVAFFGWFERETTGKPTIFGGPLYVIMVALCILVYLLGQLFNCISHAEHGIDPWLLRG